MPQYFTTDVAPLATIGAGTAGWVLQANDYLTFVSLVITVITGVWYLSSKIYGLVQKHYNESRKDKQ